MSCVREFRRDDAELELGGRGHGHGNGNGNGHGHGEEDVHFPAMTRLVLHDLQSDKRAGDLARLIESLAAAGGRLVVWVADEGRRQIFDDWLWTFDKGSFVPHIVWQETMGEVDDPVVLSGVEGNPNRATVLVVGDELPPGDWARGFDEVHDLIPPGDEGAERRAWWQRWDDGDEEAR